MTIDVGMEWASQTDIRKSNNAAIEMATADFSIVIMSPTGDWVQSIKLACLVGKDFTAPNRKMWEERYDLIFCEEM